MKKLLFLSVISLGLMTQVAFAQSLSELFSKENIESTINSVTKTNTYTPVGNWNYTRSAISLESDEALAQLGGSAANSLITKKIDEQLKKVGITAGKMHFTFKNDGTFTQLYGKKSFSGTYRYDAKAQKMTLCYARFVELPATTKVTSQKMEVLFNANALLKLLKLMGSMSSDSSIKTINKLAEHYDGMLLGFAFARK